MIALHKRPAIFEQIVPFEKILTLTFSLLLLQQHDDFAKAQVRAIAVGCFLKELMRMSLCLFVCVWSINISTLPNSRCLYNTAALLPSCLSLYLLDCFIEVHSDTLYEGEQERCIPRPEHKTSLTMSLSPPVIWALIYVLLWQRLTSFLTVSLHACTLGETTKAWVYRADEHHEG